MAVVSASRPGKAEVNIEQRPDGGITSVIPSVRAAGSQARVVSSSGSWAAIPPAAERTRPAWGRYWPRTRELAPSAATSSSAVAVLPSAKCAVTAPSGSRV